MGLRGMESALDWNQQLYWGVTYIYMLTGLTKFRSRTCIRAESQALVFDQEFYLNSLRLAEQGTGVLVWLQSVKDYLDINHTQEPDNLVRKMGKSSLQQFPWGRWERPTCTLINQGWRDREGPLDLSQGQEGAWAVRLAPRNKPHVLKNTSCIHMWNTYK